MSEQRARERRQAMKEAIAKRLEERRAQRSKPWTLERVLRGLRAMAVALAVMVRRGFGPFLRRTIGRVVLAVREARRTLRQLTCRHAYVGVGGRVAPVDGYRITTRCHSHVGLVCRKCGDAQQHVVPARADRAARRDVVPVAS